MKCTVLRYDKFLYAASWKCVRCSLAGKLRMCLRERLETGQ